MTRRFVYILGSALCGVVLGGVLSRATLAEERVALLDAKAARQEPVVLQDIKTSGSTVSGVIVNKSNHPINNVDLLIRYTWLWQNERHPGKDSPGRSSFYKIPDEIPPGGRLAFTYKPPSPLPSRSDGHFEAGADIAGFREVVPAQQSQR